MEERLRKKKEEEGNEVKGRVASEEDSNESTWCESFYGLLIGLM